MRTAGLPAPDGLTHGFDDLLVETAGPDEEVAKLLPPLTLTIDKLDR